MPEPQTRQVSRLALETAWTALIEAPLQGIGLAREAGLVFARDETDHLYLVTLAGEFRSVARAPGKVSAAAVSDDGSRVALLGDRAMLWLLDADLNLVAERPAPPDALAIAVDPHGRFVAISSRSGLTSFYNRYGKAAGRLETIQPLAFLVFVPSRPHLIGAAAFGMLAAYELIGGAGRLEAELIWEERQVSGLGRLTTTGDGSMTLASCFTHGVQRFDANGNNDGAYHLGGTATHAVPDFAGRAIAVATVEGELAVLNPAGNVRWKTGLPRPALGLEVDPLGRFLVYGLGSGEIVRLDLYGTGRPPTPAKTVASQRGLASDRPSEPDSSPTRSGQGSLRSPEWTMPAVQNEQQAEAAVLAVLDEPGRVGLFTSNLKLQLIAADGQNLGYAPEIQGVGRFLRTSPGWIAAATDRQIVVFHAARNSAQRVDLSLVEITHLAIRPDSFGLAIVQERDRVGRATTSGRWIWRQELKTPVEDVAIGPDGYCAITTDEGMLTVLDPAGVTSGQFKAQPSEPLCLIEAVDRSPDGVVWITLARRAERLRGHDLRGKVVWETQVPWEGWMLQRVGPLAFVSAPDGRLLAFDGAGHLRGQSRAGDSGKVALAATEQGEPRRVARQGVHLLCTDLDGRVRWRCVCGETVGPVAVGRSGVAAIVGRSLAWFQGLD